MATLKLTQKQRDFRNGLLFALPWIVGFLFLSVYPLIASLYYSFTEFNAVTTPRWVGLDNFKDVFSDPLVWKSLKNTLFMVFISTPVNLFVALLLATIVSRNFFVVRNPGTGMAHGCQVYEMGSRTDGYVECRNDDARLHGFASGSACKLL